MNESMPGVLPAGGTAESQREEPSPETRAIGTSWGTDQLHGALARLLDAVLETTPELGEAVLLGAVPLWFDRDLLAALRDKGDGLEDIILDRMARLSFVEVRGGRFRYRREVRRQFLRQWQKNPEGLATVHRRALERLEIRPARAERDLSQRETLVEAELYHRLAVDEPAGLERLRALFYEAEQGYRLAQAEQYLNVALDEGLLLSSEGHLYLDYMRGRLDQLYEDWEGSRARFEKLLEMETLPPLLSACLHRALAQSLVEQGRWAEGIPQYEEALESFRRCAGPSEVARTLAGLGHAYLTWALSVWGSGWLLRPPPRSRLRFLYDIGSLLPRLPLVLYLMVQLGFASTLPVVHRLGYNVDWIVGRLLCTAAKYLRQAVEHLEPDGADGNPAQGGDLTVLISTREDLAHLCRLLNHPRRAEAINKALLTMESVKRDDYRVARARLGLAHAYLLQHEAARARPELEDILPVFEKYGHQRRVAETQTLLARAYRSIGELVCAVAQYEEALKTWQRVGDEGSVTDIVDEMESLQGRSGLLPSSDEAIRHAGKQVTKRLYPVRYSHPALTSFQRVSLIVGVLVFFFALWLAIHNQAGAAVGSTAALFKPVAAAQPVIEEFGPGTVLTMRQQLRPETEPKVLVPVIVGALVSYLLLYAVIGLYFIIHTPLDTVQRGRVRGVLIDGEGIDTWVIDGESGRLSWKSITSLVLSNRSLARRPLTLLSFFALLGETGTLTVDAFTHRYQALEGRVRTRLDKKVPVRNLGFSVPGSRSGWLFLISLTYIAAFAAMSWVDPDLLTSYWDPIPYNLADLYGLAYVGVAFPLVWWFGIQPVRARFWVSPETSTVWWIGGAGLVFAVLYWVQVFWLHMPVPRPDVTLGAMAILLVTTAAVQIGTARQQHGAVAGEFVYSWRQRALSIGVAVLVVAVAVFGIIWELMSFHYLVQGNYDWARAEMSSPGQQRNELYRKALRAYGNSLWYRKEAAIYNNRGAIHSQLGEYEQAIDEYDKALRLRPREWSYVSNMGLAYAGWALETESPALQVERYGRALALHDLAVTERAVKATLYTEQLITSHLLRGDAYYNLGELYQVKGPFLDMEAALAKYKAARDDYSWVIQHAPQEPAGYTGYGWALFRIGRANQQDVMVQRQYLESATQEFEQAIEMAGKITFPEERTNRTIPAFRGLGWAHFYLATSFPACTKGEDPAAAKDNQEHLKAATAAYTLLIGEQGDAAIHYRVRAQFGWLLRDCDEYDLQKQLEASLADYDKALKLDDSHAEWYYRRGHLYYALAGVVQEADRKEQARHAALEDLASAATMEATDVSWWITLAQVAYEYRDYAAAAEGYERAAELEPKNGNHFWKLGWRLYLIGEYERSVQASTRASDLLTGEPMPYFNLGLAYAAMGDLKAALASYVSGIRVAEQLEEDLRQVQYKGGLYDIRHTAPDVSEEAVAYFGDLLQRAYDGKLHDFICKVASDRVQGLALYTVPEPEAVDGPVVEELPADAEITPLARSLDGRWLHVEVDQTGEQGWVRSSESLVTCNIDIAGLPLE